jgi:cation-transporting P-type ATPase C
VKGGIFIEQASHLDVLSFDKTGTITIGRPQVTSVMSVGEGYSENEILAWAACAEIHMTHPLSQALIRSAAERDIKIPEHKECEAKIGSGIRAVMADGVEILVGNHRLMEAYKINISEAEADADRLRAKGETILYAAKGGMLIGLIGMVDELRPEAKTAVARLRDMGIDLVLLTGDHDVTARAISDALGIDHYHHSLLPKDKADHIEEMKTEGKIVGMVGDGINDAVALAKSDLGIAIGAGGSDVAVETADIALAGNDLRKIPELILLGKRTMRIVKQNYVYSIGMNTLVIFLGAIGRISPFTGGVLHVANSLGVILNSSRILTFKDQN